MGTSSYSYDGNGNMVSDGNRGAVLTYNYLNLPKQVIVGEAPTFVRNFPSNISIETEGLKIYFFKPLKTHSINILLAGD